MVRFQQMLVTDQPMAHRSSVRIHEDRGTPATILDSLPVNLEVLLYKKSTTVQKELEFPPETKVIRAR